MSEIMRWKDGCEVICDKCGKPIYTNEPVQATITHNVKKRHAEHYFCAGGTLTVIGSPKPKIIEITTFGNKRKKEDSNG